MKFYAHIAEDENGKPLPESAGQWQPLVVVFWPDAAQFAECRSPGLKIRLHEVTYGR